MEALADGTATSFFSLIEVFNTQDEPAYCGVASIAMVLNSLAIGACLDNMMCCCVMVRTQRPEFGQDLVCKLWLYIVHTSGVHGAVIFVKECRLRQI